MVLAEMLVHNILRVLPLLLCFFFLPLLEFLILIFVDSPAQKKEKKEQNKGKGAHCPGHTHLTQVINSDINTMSSIALK